MSRYPVYPIANFKYDAPTKTLSCTKQDLNWASGRVDQYLMIQGTKKKVFYERAGGESEYILYKPTQKSIEWHKELVIGTQVKVFNHSK